jgi:hypothetical protein
MPFWQGFHETMPYEGLPAKAFEKGTQKKLS